MSKETKMTEIQEKILVKYNLIPTDRFDADLAITPDGVIYELDDENDIRIAGGQDYVMAHTGHTRNFLQSLGVIFVNKNYPVLPIGVPVELD